MKGCRKNMTVEEVYNYCFEKAQRYNMMARNFDENSTEYAEYKAKSEAYADVFLKLDSVLIEQ